MELGANKHIKPDLAKLLGRHSWTMNALATAQPKTLMMYKGVGQITAERIIAEAQKLVNDSGLHEAVQLAQPDVPLEENEEPMSARVRRIKEQNA